MPPPAWNRVKQRFLEQKNKPFKIARVLGIEESQDKTQRVALIKYFNATELEVQDRQLVGRGREIRQNVENLIRIDEAIDPPSIMAEEGDLREVIASASEQINSTVMPGSMNAEIPTQIPFEKVTDIIQNSESASLNNKIHSNVSYNNSAQYDSCSNDKKTKVFIEKNNSPTVKKVKKHETDPDIQFNIPALPKSSIVTRSKAKNL